MNDKEDKVSMYQIMAMVVIVMIVPVVRSYTIKLSQVASKGAWISAILMIVPCLLLVLILDQLINKMKNKYDVNSLIDVFDIVYGKVLGSIISVIYAIWIIFLAAIQLRLFGERLISTTFIFAPLKFFLITMLLVVYFIARNKVSNFGRFAEIILEIFGLILAIVLICSIQNIKVENLFPPTNVKGIMIGAFHGFNIFNFFTFALFLGNKIKDKEKIKKIGIRTSIVAGIIGVFGVIITLGTFGPDIVPVLPQPFFMALKVISLFGVIERIEAVFITAWVAADFIMITFNIIVASNILKQKFSLSKRSFAIAPIVLITYILSLLMANNYFTLEILAREVAYELNGIFGLGIPIVTYLVARLRKKL